MSDKPIPTDPINQAINIKQINLRTHRAAHNLMSHLINSDIPLRIQCECGRSDCDDLLEISSSNLEGVRTSRPDAFIVRRDHIAPADEEMSHSDDYSLVEKPKNSPHLI